MDRADCISPIDVRYWNPTIAQFLSEEAFIRYKRQVEAALAAVLHAYGFFGEDILAEITQACATVMVAEIVAEETRIKHDIRALANCIRARVSDRAKPFVHYMATSQDIIDTANVLRFCERGICKPSGVFRSGAGTAHKEHSREIFRRRGST